MKKKIVFRGLLGAPIGLTVCVIISIVISLTVKDGHYYPVVPELVYDCGSEINAVIIQAVLALLYGAAWAGASVIWQLDNWSILKQTVVHLIICSLATLPIAYFAYWMPHNTIGVLLYFGIFFAIYLVVWLSQYSSMKKRVSQINEKINKDNN